MKIEQLYVDTHGLFFKDGLISRYGFREYTDNTSPTLFLGICYKGIDVINSHKGIKIVHCITPLDELNVNKLNKENLFLFYGPHIDKSLNLNMKKLNIEFKNYNLFKPNTLGNKIYCYMRDKIEFKFELTKQIEKKSGYEIIYGGTGIDVHTYLSIEELKEKYYDNCFLNLNLSEKHGFVTVRELGLMGRKTIMNTPYDFPSIIKFNDIDHIIELINQESKKIGTIQESINPHHQSDDWLFLDFWKN